MNKIPQLSVLFLLLFSTIAPLISGNENSNELICRNDNINYNTGYIHYIIGLIKDGELVYIDNDVLYGAEFTVILVVDLCLFYDENNTEIQGINIFPPGEHGIFLFQNYSGIFNDKFICGKFINEGR